MRTLDLNLKSWNQSYSGTIALFRAPEVEVLTISGMLHNDLAGLLAATTGAFPRVKTLTFEGLATHTSDVMIQPWLLGGWLANMPAVTRLVVRRSHRDFIIPLLQQTRVYVELPPELGPEPTITLLPVLEVLDLYDVRVVVADVWAAHRDLDAPLRELYLNGVDMTSWCEAGGVEETA